MDWKQFQLDLARGQRESDATYTLKTLRSILSSLSLDAGLARHDSQTDVENVYAEVSKLLASKHPLVRKLAGWIVLIIGNDDDFENRQLHLLAINSLIANGTHPDFVTRGKALTVSRQLRRFHSSSELETMPPFNAEALNDCEYVRRLAVLFFAGTTEADARRLVDLISSESDPVVVVNALVAIAAIESGDSLLTSQFCLSCLSKLASFSEPSEASFIVVLTELTERGKIEWSSEEVIESLNLLDGALDGDGGPAILSTASRFLLRLVRASSLDIKADLRTQIFRRILPSLRTQLEKGDPEIGYEVLRFLSTEIDEDPTLCDPLTRDGIDWCRVSPRDPVFVVLEKMEMLVKLATHRTGGGKKNTAFLHSILSQLLTWSSASHNSAKIVETSLVAVTRIRNLSMKTLLDSSSSTDESRGNDDDDNDSQSVFRRCMNHILELLDQPSPVIIASALNALRDALQDFDEFAVDVGKDAADGASDGGARSEDTYLHELMSKLPRCILILEKAKWSLRERAISSVLFLIDKYSWALSNTAPAYVLEDLFLGHFTGRGKSATSSTLKLEFLSTALGAFADRPNQTLPVLKDALTRFGDDRDIFLNLKTHKFFHLFGSLRS